MSTFPRKWLVLFLLLHYPLTLLAYQPPEAFENDPWDYMEQEFVTKVNDYWHTHVMWLLEKTIPGLFGIAGGEIACKAAEILHKKNQSTSESIIIPSLGILLGINVSTYFLGLCIKLLFQRIACKVLLQFLDEWETNKEFTPPELQTFFTRLNNLLHQIKGKQLLENSSFEIVVALRKIISLAQEKDDYGEILLESITNSITKNMPSKKQHLDLSETQDKIGIALQLVNEE